MAYDRRWALACVLLVGLGAWPARWLGPPSHLAAQVAAPVTFRVVNALDDVNESDSAFDGAATTTWIGTAASASSSYAGLRFPLSIPPGAAIASARLEVNAAQTQWLALAFELGIEDAGNAATFSHLSPPSARLLTARRLTHSSNELWQQNAWQLLGEVGPLLQDVVNRADWTASSSAVFVLRGQGGPWGRKFAHSFDAQPALAPRLVVVYQTDGTAPPPIPPPPAPPPPAAGFSNDAVLLGLDQPTSITFTPDGRMLVTERAGRVRVTLPGRNSYEPTPFLQLANVEATVGERALVNLALDPGFASNGYYYVFYTRGSPLRNVVSRFTATGNTTSLATERVIFEDSTAAPDVHHGGGLVFGTDGRLYIAVGDGQDSSAGTTHVSQRLTSYRGKVLRLNPDGSVPADNPFHDGTGPNLDAIWALGLRNPFRMSVDALTGRVHVYDVGQNLWEEIDVLSRGANFGWPICEGTCGTSGFTNPLFAYQHPTRDGAIGGGVVYRGTAFPASHRGNLFYGDYAQSWIRRLVLAADGSVTQDLPFEPPDGSPDGPTGYVVDLDVGPDGALYYVDIGGGAVHRVSYFTGDQPPTIASVTASPTNGAPPLTVQFAVEASDPEGQPLTFAWQFGDGATATTRNPLHEYTAGGTFSARVLVSDGTQTTYSSTLTISVGTGPTVTMSAPAAGALFNAADVVAFAGQGTNGAGPLPASAHTWSVIFHHDTHTHPAYGPITGITSGSFTVPSSGHDFSGNTWYEVVLTVSDAQGRTAAASRAITPRKVNITLASNPPGLQLGFDAQTQAAPFVRDTLVNFTHRLTAASPQVMNGTSYEFVSWSDGGAAIHDITAPATAATRTATFRPITAAGPTTVTIPLADPADDVNEANGGFEPSAAAMWVGNHAPGGASYSGWRFAGVNVPRGATIVSARVEVNAAATQWISLQYEVGADNTGNSAPFSATARPSTRALAAPRVAHASNEAWVGGTWYAIDGLAPLAQAVIGRADWAPLNSLTFVVRGTGQPWGQKYVRSREAGAATAPRLVITYNPPPP